MYNNYVLCILQDENVHQEYARPTYANVTLRNNRQYLRGTYICK